MNVAVIQRQNGYNQYYFALDSTFFEANLTRPRPGRGQLVEAKAETEARILASRSVWPRDLNVMVSDGWSTLTVTLNSVTKLPHAPWLNTVNKIQ